MLPSRHQNAGQNHDIKIGNRRFENVAQARYLGTLFCWLVKFTLHPILYIHPSAPSMLTSRIHLNVAHRILISKFQSNAVKFLLHFLPLPITSKCPLPNALPSSFPNVSPYLQSAKRTSLRNFKALSFLPLKYVSSPIPTLSLSLSLSSLSRSQCFKEMIY
jgi:hypothetical protein